MIDFDKPLLALADCPVLSCDEGAYILFGPHPVISCSKGIYLAHEICHRLAGRQPYAMFHTACLARQDPLFKQVLNMLCDWYDEYVHGRYSSYLWQALTALHASGEKPQSPSPTYNTILDWYDARDVDPVSKGVRDMVDLIRMADEMCERIRDEKQDAAIIKLFGQHGKFGGNGRGAGGDVGGNPQSSTYYFKAVAKYDGIIRELSTIWKNNRYAWRQSYFGEVNWRNLPHLFAGEKMRLPVFRLYQKILLARRIYLVVDRSGSTGGIHEVIMDSAIIIAESLRRRSTPISVLDVGVEDRIINKINEPLNLNWFTPMSKGGTPLGEVCSQIDDANHDSYLLIVTDGQPNSWDTLLTALRCFPGSHLTFVIGDSYGTYLEKVKNAISVQPHTIVRELYNERSLR